ncbi:MAG: sulfate adenylyltransferase subunit CysN [Planctomycetota bacterium]
MTAAQTELIASDINAYLAQHERKEMLRFLTCGSVDDGKSTLIGRLLYDSKMVYEDQLAALEVDSKRFGTTGGEFDPALLTDGLKAEREQGITIDVAYRYFSTAKRKFIIADTPGHEQYTRNMATGASTADLAIILIDARHGVQTQTRRHSFIASLLGIKHVVVAINKMDLVDFSEDRYEEIRLEYADFAAKLDLPDVRFVPMSALNGDNVVNPSEHTPWYRGGTLMHILETVHIGSDRNLIDLRFPVQYVNRPDLNFRGFTGTLASGVVRKGDEVMVLPSGKTSKVKSIVTFEGEIDEAFAPMSPTITLEDEIDASRGDMLVHPNNQPTVSQAFEAMLVWMNEEALEPGRPYLIKQTTRQTPGVITSVRYRMDVNTLHRHDETDGLELNEIGRVVVELARPLCFDPYTKNRGTGGFIVIDRLTHNTVAAGMILDRSASAEQAARDRLAQSLATHATQHHSLVNADERAARLKQQPATVWFTGMTGSGKSPIAYALERRLFDEGYTTLTLDGRNNRLGLSSDLTFSDADRAENLRRAAHVAKLANQNGLITVCAFLSPGEADRAVAREVLGDHFIEVFTDAPEDVCKQRAEEQGSSMAAFSDLAAPYEPPSSPDLRLATDELSIDACVEQVMALLRERGVLG